MRWVLRYDYPINEEEYASDEEQSAPKEWILEQHLAWIYSQEQTDQLIAYKRSINSQMVLYNEPVFAEVMPYGVLVHYKDANASRGRTLLWSGQTIRGHVLGGIRADGTVVLKKNRRIIVLQLMKGADPCSFSSLF